MWIHRDRIALIGELARFFRKLFDLARVDVELLQDQIELAFDAEKPGAVARAQHGVRRAAGE